MRQFGPGSEDGLSDEEVEEQEARMANHLETLWGLAERIFATPARTWGDS